MQWMLHALMISVAGGNFPGKPHQMPTIHFTPANARTRCPDRRTATAKTRYPLDKHESPDSRSLQFFFAMEARRAPSSQEQKHLRSEHRGERDVVES